MKPVEPIHTIELFPALSIELLDLLKRLPATAWTMPTACADWTVKDIVAHLLGGNLGRLSFGRDKLIHPAPSVFPEDYPSQVAFINRQNADWVNTARGISANLLVEFLELTDRHLYHYFNTLAPLAPSGISVSWAGETQSLNWFDIAREFTEKWLHQQHIREAVGQPLLLKRKWLYPVLDTFLRALPHTYRGVEAANGTVITFKITGEAGGDWSLLRQDDKWRLLWGEATTAVASVRLDQDSAWRLFTKGVSPSEAIMEVEGDRALGMEIVQMVSIMA